MEEFSYCGISCYPKWVKAIEKTRNLFARLINAAPNEISFTGNTSEGLSTVATGVKWKDGDVVMVPVPDFPTNIYPWMNLERLGVKVHFVEKASGGRFGLDQVKKALLPRTRLLTVSSVDFCTGFRCDLAALGDFCRRKGILFCVDGIQSLGVIPMDVERFGIHFLAGGGHKWLLSTMGIGALYVSKEVNEEIHPTRVGWKSVVDEEDFFRVHFDLKPDALRFEPGTMNLLGIAALGAAIELLLNAGIEEIMTRVFALNEVLRDGLRLRGLEVISSMIEHERSGIVSFLPSVDPGGLFHFLSNNNVMVSLRGDKIRLSPHFYNNESEVEAFFRTLDSFPGPV
jgi:cysteine desulfurase/selenocysteine lyase